MPVISSFYGILIQMFWNDHPPPHFHVRYGDYAARVSIGSGMGAASSGRSYGKLVVMRTSADTGKNRSIAMTSEIISPIICNQPDDVVQVQPLDGFRLYVYFGDGTGGEVEMSELIHGPHAGVFAGLADPARFAEAYVQYGAVVWPGNIDLAPDAMYSEIQKTGKWILG